MIKFVALLTLLAAPSIFGQNDQIPDTTIILSEYRVEIEYPFPAFLTRQLAKLAGFAEPKKMFLEETIVGDRKNGNFFARIWDNHGQVWFELSSDTLKTNSFLQPPAQPKEFLKISAVNFVMTLRKFLSDSSYSWESVDIEFGGEKIRGTIYRKNSKTIGFYTDFGKKREISGEIKTAEKDSCIIYPHATVSFHSVGITLKARIETVTITKK